MGHIPFKIKTCSRTALLPFMSRCGPWAVVFRPCYNVKKSNEILGSSIYSYYSLLNDKKRSKYLVLRPGARRTFRLSSRKPRIPLNALLFFLLKLLKKQS